MSVEYFVTGTRKVTKTTVQPGLREAHAEGKEMVRHREEGSWAAMQGLGALRVHAQDPGSTQLLMSCMWRSGQWSASRTATPRC